MRHALDMHAEALSVYSVATFVVNKDEYNYAVL